jgi:hypothetical protein
MVICHPLRSYEHRCFQDTVRYQFLYTAFTLNLISDKHCSLVVIFSDTHNCAYGTVEVVFDSNQCNVSEN